MEVSSTSAMMSLMVNLDLPILDLKCHTSVFMAECSITSSVASLLAAGGVFLVLIKIEEGVTLLVLLWYLGLGISEDLLFL
eukprot:6374658-Ditylum_brightwellii.AAC.1